MSQVESDFLWKVQMGQGYTLSSGKATGVGAVGAEGVGAGVGMGVGMGVEVAMNGRKMLNGSDTCTGVGAGVGVGLGIAVMRVGEGSGAGGTKAGMTVGVRASLGVVGVGTVGVGATVVRVGVGGEIGVGVVGVRVGEGGAADESSARGLGEAQISHAFDKGWLMNVHETHDQHAKGCWGLIWACTGTGD
jgi:hypothetical protein